MSDNKEIKKEEVQENINLKEPIRLKELNVKKGGVVKDTLSKIIVPNVKKLGATILHSFVEYFINGKPISTTNFATYDRRTVRENPYWTSRRSTYVDDRIDVINSPNFSVGSIRDRLYFNHEEQAVACLTRMIESANEYGGYITVADLKEIVGERVSFTDRNFGWTLDALNDSDIVLTKQGFKLALPVATTFR